MKSSIIIPVYKTPRELFLACVESVLAWQNKSLEVILVIDSPGHEIEKDVYEVAARDARVKVIRNAVNQGPSYSRNRGIDLAQGEYLMMVDADDRIIPEACETALRHCVDNDLDYCAVARVYPWQRAGVDCFETKKLYRGSFVESCALSEVLKRLDMSSSGVWYKRSFLHAHRIYYPENLRQNEDFVFTTSILSRGGSVGIWDEYGYRITLHRDSLSQNRKAVSFYVHQLSAALRIMQLIKGAALPLDVLKFYAEHGYNQIFASWHKAVFESSDMKKNTIAELSYAAASYCKTYRKVLSLSARALIGIVDKKPNVLFRKKPIVNYLFRAIRKWGWYYV